MAGGIFGSGFRGGSEAAQREQVALERALEREWLRQQLNQLPSQLWSQLGSPAFDSTREALAACEPVPRQPMPRRLERIAAGLSRPLVPIMDAELRTVLGMAVPSSDPLDLIDMW